MGVHVTEHELFQAATNFAASKDSVDAKERLCSAAVVYAAAKQHAADSRDKWKARKGKLPYR
jgi:hypothetical protein